LKVCNSNGKTEFLKLELLPTPTAHQQGTKYNQGGTCLQAKLLPTPSCISNFQNYQYARSFFKWCITLAVCVAGAIEAANLSTDTKQQYELHASHTN